MSFSQGSQLRPVLTANKQIKTTRLPIVQQFCTAICCSTLYIYLFLPSNGVSVFYNGKMTAGSSIVWHGFIAGWWYSQSGSDFRSKIILLVCVTYV